MFEVVASGLERLDCRALLVVAASSREPDLSAFVGSAHLGASFLILPRGGAPALGYFTAMERDEAASTGLSTLSPEALGLPAARGGGDAGEMWASAIGAGLELCGVKPGAVALAGSGPAGELREWCRLLEGQGWSFRSANALVRLWRKRKTARQLEESRRSARGAGGALRRAAGILAACRERNGELWIGGERARAGHLRDAIALHLATCGLEQPEGNIVAQEGESAVPHSQGASETVLRPGVSIVVDLYPRGEMFADVTRTFCVGAAPAGLVKAHRAVQATLESSCARVVPGVTGWELQVAACRELAAEGFETPLEGSEPIRGYVHGLGHGVGLELHEDPSFRRSAGESGTLQVGDLFTLEPGLYFPEERFGVRLEDLVFLGADGVEILTPLPYDLDPRAWQPELA